jgi:23S rRNA pseudouridine1911/1915/1917 synthase
MAELRLDQVLAGRSSVTSRGKARQALESGKVSVNGQAVGGAAAGERLAVGTEVWLEWNRPGTTHQRNAGRERLRKAGVEVIFEDALLLAVNKPVGLLTDSATRAQDRNNDTLTKRARGWAGGREVWPVHRIDRDTSGVVLFAKGQEARENLKEQWGKDKPVRAYTVVVEGAPKADAGTWSHWMFWDGKVNRQKPCGPGTPEAVEAKASYEVVERFAQNAVLLVKLDTGRRNQIRLHCQIEGYPLVGELIYRKDSMPTSFGRQALHASELVVKHPKTGAVLSLKAELPDDMKALVKRLRKGPKPPPRSTPAS